MRVDDRGRGPAVRVGGRRRDPARVLPDKDLAASRAAHGAHLRGGAREARCGPPARILEPYSVKDLGEMPPATVLAELRARYPGLLPNGVEVEPLVAAGDVIGYVVRTRNIIVYAYLDRSLGEYSIRLSGVGKYQQTGGGSGR